MSRKGGNRAAELRHAARRCAVQALYQWQLTGLAGEDIIAQFQEQQSVPHGAEGYFEMLLLGVIKQAKEMDVMLAPLLDRPVQDVTAVEMAVLRMGVWELRYQSGLPFRVVLNEAILLARAFGASQSYKYVNGVLDQLARQLRPKEHSEAPVRPKKEEKDKDL